MDDIRLFETDGDYLVLEAQDGQKYRLLVDEGIRSSIKREPKVHLDSITITPREIQDEIRNGASIDELIKKSGASFEFIEKFAAPVLAELEHIVSSALSVRLTIAGDRYNDSTQIEFGEIIASRLVTSGATGISWLARKMEANTWHVIANYSLNGVSGSATWSFDPRKLTLSPESETAVSLSTQETINNSVIPKLRPVLADDQVGATEVAAPIHQAPTEILDDVIPISRSNTFNAIDEISPPQSFEKPAPSTPAAFAKKKETLEDEQPLSATADLLEALRRKRSEREDSPVEVVDLQPEPQTEAIRIVEIEPVVTETQTSEHQVEQVSEKESDEASKPAVKKGRASMPSWDEIVFGTKADD
jgi:hypothetical protein